MVIPEVEICWKKPKKSELNTIEKKWETQKEAEVIELVYNIR